MKTPLTDLQANFNSINNGMVTICQSTVNYLASPSTQPLPDLVGIVNGMSSTELETHAQGNSMSSNNTDHGTVVEGIDRAFAIRREIALRGMIKADFYNHGSSELDQEIASIYSNSGFDLNSIKGRTQIA